MSLDMSYNTAVHNTNYSHS